MPEKGVSTTAPEAVAVASDPTHPPGFQPEAASAPAPALSADLLEVLTGGVGQPALADLLAGDAVALGLLTEGIERLAREAVAEHRHRENALDRLRGAA